MERKMFNSKTNVVRLYRSVMDDVLDSIAKDGSDVGADDQTLAELRRLWLAKLAQSGALEADYPFCVRAPLLQPVIPSSLASSYHHHHHHHHHPPHLQPQPQSQQQQQQLQLHQHQPPHRPLIYQLQPHQQQHPVLHQHQYNHQVSSSQHAAATGSASGVEIQQVIQSGGLLDTTVVAGGGVGDAAGVAAGAGGVGAAAAAVVMGTTATGIPSLSSAVVGSSAGGGVSGGGGVGQPMKRDVLPRITMHQPANQEGRTLLVGSHIVPCNVAAQLLRSGQGPLDLEEFSQCAGRLAKLTRKSTPRSTSKRSSTDRDNNNNNVNNGSNNNNTNGSDTQQQQPLPILDEEPLEESEAPGCSGVVGQVDLLPGQSDGAAMSPGSDIELSSDDNDSFSGDEVSDTAPESPSSSGNREVQDPDELLNSGDDEEDPVGDNEQPDDIENIVVCQYLKVHRKGAHWKIRLTQGIMNIEGKDYAFSRMDGEADW